MEMLIAGLVFTIIWAALFFTGWPKYSESIEIIDKKAYPLHELVVTGVSLLSLAGTLGFNIHKSGIKTKSNLCELYSADHDVVNNLYVLHVSALITYALITLPFGCFIGALSGEPIVGVLIGLLGIFIAYVVHADLKSRVDGLHEEIQYDFPNVLADLALLVRAGSTVRQAWEMVSASGDKKVYLEMQSAVRKMKSGFSEKEAYDEFTERCRLNEVRKFTSILIQNIKVGNPNLVEVIQDMAAEAWEIKRHIARRRGAAAADKLMLPTFIIFAGILTIIIVPILTNMMSGL